MEHLQASICLFLAVLFSVLTLLFCSKSGAQFLGWRIFLCNSWSRKWEDGTKPFWATKSYLQCNQVKTTCASYRHFEHFNICSGLIKIRKSTWAPWQFEWGPWEPSLLFWSQGELVMNLYVRNLYMSLSDLKAVTLAALTDAQALWAWFAGGNELSKFLPTLHMVKGEFTADKATM